jgi:CheY-like chemotaxis protein/CHASE3 domain sensor protein/putative methionine-R-sulfoxide reductase with GAF domain
MEWTIGRRLAGGYVIALCALLIVSGIAYRNLLRFEENAAWVAHTFEVLGETAALKADIYAAQLFARDFALTREPEYETKFRTTKGHIQESTSRLRGLTADNPIQQRRFTSLQALTAERLRGAEQTIARARDQPTSAATITAEALRPGIEQLSAITELLVAIEGEERALLANREATQNRDTRQAFTIFALSCAAAAFLIVVGGLRIARSITSRVAILEEGANKIGAGDYTHRVALTVNDELGRLATHFNNMAARVAERDAAQIEQDWQKSRLAEFGQLFQQERNAAALCQRILSRLAVSLEIQQGAFYVKDEAATLRLQASYARENARPAIAMGEGLIGQCALERQPILLHDLPAEYLIHSALGEAAARFIVILPAMFEGDVKGVVELASFTALTQTRQEFLLELLQAIGAALHNLVLNERTERLLERAQSLSQNLQLQHERLAEANRELESQKERLLQSERQLIEQQQELKQANNELEQTNEEFHQTNIEMQQQTALLSEQKRKLQLTNLEIAQAHHALEEKAQELTQLSQYKSDFLANMSHELRTPLNSLLILSKLLVDNPDDNLTPKQLQYAHTIEASGHDLLDLINDILDLAKVESGAMELEFQECRPLDLKKFAEASFAHMAEQKSLQFEVVLEPALPAALETNTRRVEQVIKNLLANAIKFTERGRVTLRMRRANDDWQKPHPVLDAAATVVAFDVIDTGIGIPADKLQLIFEAFQQGDAGTARKYGGTGLGLSISKEIARLLGGALKVQSEPRAGSTFTLYLPSELPDEFVDNLSARAASRDKTHPVSHTSRVVADLADNAMPAPLTADDRDDIQAGDRVLLIVEDDRHFAGVLVDYARSRGFKARVARGAAEGLTVAQRIAPTIITLDLVLPDYEGWVLLDRLKHDNGTRHIPVHVISVSDQRQRSLTLGAVSHLQKPVTREALDTALNYTLELLQRPLKTLLVVEDDVTHRQSIVELIGNGDVRVIAVGNAAAALDCAALELLHCAVIDLGLPDMSGTELIQQLHARLKSRTPPIIVYTGRALSRREETELRLLSDAIIVKGVKSPERLLEETTLFLHRRFVHFQDRQRRMLELARKIDPQLAERKVLVVDDDVRNIFAITSGLEGCGMHVIYAESGPQALELLDSQRDLDVVLMDVMMPEMDGLEALRRLRQLDHCRHLPVICVTAKAMKGDREQCLSAGASDYITKPVDMEQLRSVLRVCLYRS